MIDLQVLEQSQPLRIALGAGAQRWDGWIPLQKEDLDLLSPNMWQQKLGQRRVDAFLCEHVWEHLSEVEGRAAARLCFEYLKPGGYIRCAVPDGNFPNGEYQNMVKIGGPGTKDHPAVDHKIVYEYRLLMDVFKQSGFVVDLLEYCDETGRFHYNQWSWDDGPIYRSLLNDHRNKDGKLGFVSLIIDAHKPK